MESAASSGDEEFVVHKKKINKSGTHLLSDSEDDSRTQPSPLTSDEESPLASSENASIEKCSKANGDLDTKENQFPRRRIIRDPSSDDENFTSNYFGKSTSNNCPSIELNKYMDTDSDSNCKKTVKSSRIKKRDKMVDRMKRRFDKKGKINPIPKVKNDIVKPVLSLCDKDTSTDSDEDQPSLTINSAARGKVSLGTESKESGSKRKEVKRKTTKLIEAVPTPKRMSSKEAMENMTKIKSESNRMLRESHVLLPYHRPKQVTLKDILSRKKPGPDLPLRMNQEQLEQYANELEESQKKMKELYKSDDEENADVLCEIEPIDKLNVLENIKEKSIHENPDGKDDQNCFVNANKECELLGMDNETSTENKPVENLFNNNLNQTSVDIISVNEVNIDTSEIIPVDSGNDKIQESIQLAESVSSEHYTNVDSQQINLHYDSESININKERGSSSCREQDTSGNLDDDISNQNNVPLNTTECTPDNIIVNTTNSTNSKIGSITEPSSELYENDKKNINEEANSNTHDYTCTDEKETSRESVTELTEDYSFDDNFPDDDVDISHIEAIMEKIESDKDHYRLEDSPMLIKDDKNVKPRLSGAPGMVIDLDAPSLSNKMSGVEMLKHRYMFFSNIKTPQEKEREKEKQMKPGAKHRLLKLELGKQIAEQSIAEWTKRVEEEKQQQKEIMAVNGELSDCEDELDKMEKQVGEEEKDSTDNVLADIEQEEGDEDEVQYEEEKCMSAKERPKKSNSLIEDEAEVENDEEAGDDDEDAGEDDDDVSRHDDAHGDGESDSSAEDSSTEEEDTDAAQKPRKGRIIKAFEDSDDEEQTIANEVKSQINGEANKENEAQIVALQKCRSDLFESQTTDPDEEISLAQPNQSNPEDMNISLTEDSESKKENAPKMQTADSERMTILLGTQHNTEVDMEAIVGMCSGNFPSDNPRDLPPVPAFISGLVGDGGAPNSQLIGENILQLCSGKFDEHLMVTQTIDNNKFAETPSTELKLTAGSVATDKDNASKRLLDELDDDDLDLPKTNRYFGSNIKGISASLNHDTREENSMLLQKGKLVIESSDEETDGKVDTKKKKFKRKKPDKRALVISDDEEEDCESELSELEDEDLAVEGERLVEYDSEENEVEVVTEREVRRRAHDFMEREAELSSEGEWAGSGDEDERGLDRLEREAGDDDVFNQGRLQRELGQMHAQDLMEQDRHEVRLLQEILLEDGDLEGGGRQRRFRWKDTGGPDESGTVPDEFGDTPEEERESEEQWRRQRHERQLFLRQLASENTSEEDILGLGTTASSLIASSVRVQSASVAPRDGEETNGTAERNQAMKDLPSPVKNTFTLMQRQYRALVSGGGGAAALRKLAAALAPATATTASSSAERPPGQRSFAFAPLAHPAPAPHTDGELFDDHGDAPPRKTKRKADVPVGTPKLIKKLRLQEQPRKSILQQLDS